MIDELFDEVLLAKDYFQNSNEVSYFEKWVPLFTHFHKQHTEVPNLKKIVEFTKCLPRTSAPVQKNVVWRSGEDGRMRYWSLAYVQTQLKYIMQWILWQN